MTSCNFDEAFPSFILSCDTFLLAPLRNAFWCMKGAHDLALITNSSDRSSIFVPHVLPQIPTLNIRIFLKIGQKTQRDMNFETHGGDSGLKIYKTPMYAADPSKRPIKFVDRGAKSGPFGEMCTTTKGNIKSHAHGPYLWYRCYV